MSDPDTHPSDPPGHLPIAGWTATTILTLVACTALRFAAALKELWLDEIWAIRIVDPLASALEIWTRVRTDNHSLYSLYLYFAGPQAPEQLYRLPSLLAGIGSMGLVGLIAREQLKRDREQLPDTALPSASLIATLLIGFSYLFVHFDSEARGYALCVCFCLLAFWLLLRGEGKRHSPLAIGYWMAIALAVLAQPIGVHMLAAGGLWSCWRWFRTRRSWTQAAAEALWWHLMPSAFFVVFYLAYVRLLQTGGATDVSLLAGSSGAWAYTLGLPISLGGVCLAIGGLITAVGLACLIRQHNDLWIFYAAAVVISPLLLCLLRRSPYNYERYFIVNAAMALLMTAHFLARLRLTGQIGRLVCLFLLTTFALGNALYSAHLLRNGRGQYLPMLEHIMQNSSQSPATLSSDHDFRHTMVLNFHLQRLTSPLPQELVYYPQAKRPRQGTQWLLTHAWEGDPAPAPLIQDQHSNIYELANSYPASYLAGFRLHVYRQSAR